MLERTVKEISTVKIPTPVIESNAAVRMGSFSTTFPPIRDKPNVIADHGNIRMGSFSPPFPEIRAK
jgi:hypothetical protein